MNDEVEMSFSGILGDKNKHVAVSFSYGDKYAEGEIPACKIKKNKGFSREEVESLEDYLLKNQDDIFNRAKKINPMRAFLGKT